MYYKVLHELSIPTCSTVTTCSVNSCKYTCSTICRCSINSYMYIVISIYTCSRTPSMNIIVQMYQVRTMSSHIYVCENDRFILYFYDCSIRITDLFMLFRQCNVFVLRFNTECRNWYNMCNTTIHCILVYLL
jgi:hypothetical protein